LSEISGDNLLELSPLKVYVLDSFALVAYIQGEPAAKRVKDLFSLAASGECQILISWINLGEVVYLTERRRGFQVAQEVLGLIHALPIERIDVSSVQILEAAHIKANYPVSYADAFAIALALECAATVLTGDAEFRTVEDLIEVEFLT
jgi:ribonuclease VapC